MGFCLLMTASTAEAKGPPGWVDDILETADGRAYSDAPALILYDYTQLEVDEEFQAKIRQRRLVRILKSDGLHVAALEVAVSGEGELNSINAWTISDGRLPVSAGKRDVAESTEHPIGYSDTRSYWLRAPKVRVGDLVAFECSYKTKLPFPAYRWLPQWEMVPVDRAVLELRFPDGWDVEGHPSGMAPRERDSSKGRRVFEAGPLTEIPDEVGRPSLYYVVPKMLIRFLDPEGTYTFSTWQEIASWYYAKSAPKFAVTSDLADLTEQASTAAPMDALRVYASEAQHSINYIAIELGEQGWIPDLAADTWRRRYGDCKDKATVMIAALATQNIKARPVIVCTSDRWAVDPDAPSPSHFNHVIVAFEWNGDSSFVEVVAEGPSGKIWAFFDPTAPHVPLGYLPQSVAGTWAVLADSAEGLVRLPAKPTLKLRQESTVRLNKNGLVESSTQIIGEGLGGGLLAHLYELESHKPAKWIASMLGNDWTGTEISGLQFEGVDSTKFRAAIRFSVSSQEIAKTWSTSWIIRPHKIRALASALPSDTLRTLPLWLDGPFRFEDRVEIYLPPGFAVEGLPEFEWQGELGEYVLRYESQPGKIILHRHYEIHEQLVPADRYAEVRDLWQTAYRGDAASILVSPVE
jgi:hypothetical protein